MLLFCSLSHNYCLFLLSGHFSKGSHVDVVLFLKLLELPWVVLLLFFLPAVPRQYMIVTMSDQFNKCGWFLSIAPATLFPSYLIHCAHSVEWQDLVRDNIREHLSWVIHNAEMSSGIRQCRLFESSPANDNEVNLHPAVLHPHLSLWFMSLKEDHCARAFHPGHDVEMSSQVSLLSSQRFVSVIQRLRHVSWSWVLNAVHVLKRLSCESRDYVRTTSVTQPKVSQRRRGKETKCNGIEVVIMA